MGFYSKKLNLNQMKNSLLTLFLIIHVGVFAQLTFTLDSIIDGSQILTYRQEILNGGLGPMQGNQQWNFSYFEGDSGIVIRLADSNLFPSFIAPPGANKLLIKQFENGEAPFDGFNFLKADASGLERLTLRADGMTYAAYSTPYKELQFPVVYNPDQILSTASFTLTEAFPFGEFDSIRTHSTINLYYSVPAYGPLTLPNNIVHQVLVVQRLETVRDSIELYQNGAWTFLSIETQFREHYDFLSPSLGYYVMMAEYFEGEKGGTNYTIYYLHNTSTVDVKPVAESNITFFPNPSNDIIYIQSDEPLDFIEIYDLQGRSLKRKVPTHENSIAVSDLSAGCYLFKCAKAGNTFIKKVVVQH
jgi:hypothetical protein